MALCQMISGTFRWTVCTTSDEYAHNLQLLCEVWRSDCLPWRWHSPIPCRAEAKQCWLSRRWDGKQGIINHHTSGSGLALIDHALNTTTEK